MPDPKLSDRRWVLVTSGDHRVSRAAAAAVKALALAGYRPAVTVSGGASIASVSRYCRRRVAVPSVTSDPEGYARAIRMELRRTPYLTVLPITEAVLLALDLPILHLVNKVECAAIAVRAGIRVPESRLFSSAQELRDHAQLLDYPVVIKPDIKRQPAFRADSPADVRSARLVEGRFVAQPYLEDELRGVLGLMWQGKLVASVHMRYIRIWPVPCGTAAAAETVSPDLDLERRLEALLAGYQGLFHVDLAGPYLLDVNPRVHATLPVGISAGVNLVALYCDLLRGRSVDPVRAPRGHFYRWIEGDVRTVLQSVRNGRMSVLSAALALAPRRGAAHSFEALLDPAPMAVRLAQIATHLAPTFRAAGRGRRIGGTSLR